MSKTIAIITGASSGLGYEFATLLDKASKNIIGTHNNDCKYLHTLHTRKHNMSSKAVREHYNIDEIWLIARRKQKLEQLALLLDTSTRIFSLDLAKTEPIEIVQRALQEEQPHVAWLINAAGLAKFSSVQEHVLSDIDMMVDVNIKALTKLCAIVIPYMFSTSYFVNSVKHGKLTEEISSTSQKNRKSCTLYCLRDPKKTINDNIVKLLYSPSYQHYAKKSHIINIASAVSYVPLPQIAVYAATKRYVLDFSQALSFELHKNITVTAVCPKAMRTEFFDHVHSGTSHSKLEEKVQQFGIEEPRDVAICALRDAVCAKSVSISDYGTQLLHLVSRVFPMKWIIGIARLMKYIE